MPTYLITAPDGRKFNVTGPGTAEEALAHIQQSAGAAPSADTPPAMASEGQIQDAYNRTNPLAASGGTALSANAGAGDFFKTAGSNIIPSAKRFGGDIAQAVMHPVDTTTNLMKVIAGLGEKVIPGQQRHEVYADAIGKFFAERYGGMDNIKKTMAEDPVGFLGDLSTVLGIGGVVRAPGVAGEVSRVAGTVGRVIDPINATVKVAKTVGKGVGNVASEVAGLSTGAGATPLKVAAKAGFEGGASAKALRDNMRGNVPMDEVVAQAKSGLDAIKNERQAAYRSGMADLSKDQTVLDFSKIDKALNATKPVKVFKGVSLEPSAAQATEQVASALHEWRNLPAADYHTPEGLDALKQRIGDIRNDVKPGSASEKIVTQVYNIIKDQIVLQAPQYAKTMENYQKASELIKEIEGTLSLNRNARVDTNLRKLQSIMRNNVNTNYGKRADLVKLLEEKGAKHVLSALAGQSLNSLAPRGLSRAVAGLVTGGGGVAAAFNPAMAAPLAGAIAMSSPRLVGEAAYLGGRGAKALSKIPATGLLRAGYQSQRDVPEWQRIRLGQ